MTRTELRVEALRMSCSRVGNPNVVQQANEFLRFLMEDEVPSQAPVASTGQNSQGRRK